LFGPAAQLLFLPFLFWRSPTGPSPIPRVILNLWFLEAPACRHRRRRCARIRATASSGYKKVAAAPRNPSVHFLLSLAHRLSLPSKPQGPELPTTAVASPRCSAPSQPPLTSWESPPPPPCSPCRRNRAKASREAVTVADSLAGPAHRRRRFRRRRPSSGHVDPSDGLRVSSWSAWTPPLPLSRVVAPSPAGPRR
jgi:hypothetical protein